MSDPKYNFSNMVCFSLYSTANAMIRDYRIPLKNCDLTYPQFIVMMALWNQDDISIKEISHQTMFDAGTLTPIIKKLANKNFLSIIPSDMDKRSKIIVLTEEGKLLEAKTAHVFADMEKALQLNNEEQAVVNSVCHKIVDRLQEN